MNIIEDALNSGRYTLSEYESKQILKAYNIPVSKEILIDNADQLPEALNKIGYPLVIKGCSNEISHKTESGMVHLDIRNQDEAHSAYNNIFTQMKGDRKQVIVQEMIKGQRELMVGMTRDPEYGPCVMFGLGGIFTEVLNDTLFRIAPLEKEDALDMMNEIKGYKILESVRGMKSVDKDSLAEILVSIGQIGIENEKIQEIDINPIIMRAGEPVAVDALMILGRD